MPVGLVEAEHEGARDAVARLELLELVVVADHPVDVLTEVQVRVEDRGALREQPPSLVVPAGDQLERTCLWLHPADPS